LAEGLSAVAPRLEAKEAAAVCARAAAALTQAMSKTTNEFALSDLAEGLSAVAARLEAKDAKEAAATLTQAMSNTTDSHALPLLAGGLSAVLAREHPNTIKARLASITTAASSGSPAVLLAPALLWPALAAPPPPLPAQALVDLLKHPFCVGQARRPVLAQLQRQYHRPFADQWDFVRFARKQNLGLDLDSPPKPFILAASPAPSRR
jgi:hypothetical protein